MPQAELDGIDIGGIRAAMAASTPRERARGLASRLGWSGERAGVHWNDAQAELGHFVLADVPTTAALVGSGRPGRESDEFTKAWRRGDRWCVAVESDRLHWCDLRSQQSWTARGSELSPADLRGFTPASFINTGVFKPSSISMSATAGVPDRHPADLLHDRLMGWWDEALKHGGVGREKIVKDVFTRVVAAIMLLRTIESAPVRPPPQLRPLESVRASEDLGQICTTAASIFNSRVLRDVPVQNLPSSILLRIIDDTYAPPLDFFDIDVDPVGRFTEEVLGDMPAVAEGAQRTIFIPSTLTKHDDSQQRVHGVYYTPRIFADLLAAQLVTPMARNAERPHELPVVFDPAAGSGELLCAALRAILSIEMWRTPEVAIRLLTSHMWAMDVAEGTLPLIATNLLRAALRMVPELVTGRLKFPSLESNLQQGDSLKPSCLAAIPMVDVVVMNPPFSGPQRWSLPDDVAPDIAAISGAPNRAIAHLCAAVSKVRDGGGIGAILPSETLAGPRTASWRSYVAERMSIDLVIDNGLVEFRPGMSARPGLVAGRRLGAVPWRARTRVTQIQFKAGYKDHDFGALLASANRPGSPVMSRLLPGITPTDAGWTLGRLDPVAPVVREDWISLNTLASPSEGFHQGAVPAPAEIGREAFLLRRGPDRRWRHSVSDSSISDINFTESEVAMSKLLRPYANAAEAVRVTPAFCAPNIPESLIILPESSETGAATHGVVIDTLDGVSRTISERIQKKAEQARNDAPDDQVKDDAWWDHMARGILSYATPKGYRSGDGPLLLLSKTTRGRVGVESEVFISAWIDETGLAVPIDGVWARFSSIEIAVAVALLVNDPRLTEVLRRNGATRNRSTTQWHIRDMASLRVPDLRLPQYEQALQELVEIWRAYVRECAPLPPDQAYQTPRYKQLRRSASHLLE